MNIASYICFLSPIVYDSIERSTNSCVVVSLKLLQSRESIKSRVIAYTDCYMDPSLVKHAVSCERAPVFACHRFMASIK